MESKIGYGKIMTEIAQDHGTWRERTWRMNIPSQLARPRS
jgi:hypothetical protein